MSKLSTHRMPLVPNSPLSASPALISSVTVSPGSRSSPTSTWPANQSEVSLQLWTNQKRVLWPADQSQLTWLQYSSSGPIRGEYCGQLTNHSSPGQQRHVVRDLGQLVRAQVQLHHVTPGPIRGEHYSCPPIRGEYCGHVTGSPPITTHHVPMSMGSEVS